jgi:hypothetical protein
MNRKWQSRRWIIAAWAIIMTTWLIVFSSLRGQIPEGLEAVTPLLIGIAGAYIAADSLTKPKSPGGPGDDAP